MTRKLIISLDTYSWFRYCAGFIMQDPSEFSVIILFNDDHKPIYGFNHLCKDAVFTQRSHDLLVLKNAINVSRISNFEFDDANVDIKRLIAMLQFEIVLKGYSEVIFQDNDFTRKIFEGFKKKIKVKYHCYGNMSGFDEKNAIVVRLNDREFGIKQCSMASCAGISHLGEIVVSNIEKIYPV